MKNIYKYDIEKMSLQEVFTEIGKKVHSENPELKTEELYEKVYDECCNNVLFITAKSYRQQRKYQQKVEDIDKIVETKFCDYKKVVVDNQEFMMNPSSSKLIPIDTFEEEKERYTNKLKGNASLPLFTLDEVLCPSNPQNIKSTFYRVFDASWLPRKNPFFHKEDNNKFVRATLKLFPNTNAFSFGHTLTVFRKFIENIYYNLGFEGLKPQQTAIYQFSAIGGTGKSEFNNRLRHFLSKMDISFVNSAPKGRWVSAEYSRNLVALCDEWIPPRGSDVSETIGKINNVIDDVDYKIEYKYQDSMMAKSICSLIFNSNYKPFDDNDRRYGIIEYNETPFEYISNEDKAKYFPERTDDEWDEIFLEAFESCPFGKVWKDVHVNNSEDFDLVIDIAREVTEDTHLSDPECATISEVSKAYQAIHGGDTKEIKRLLRKVIRKSVAERKIEVAQKINGSIDYSKYDWIKIATMNSSEDAVDSPLNKIDNTFERTVFASRTFLEKDNSPEPTDNTRLSDGNIFVEQFEGEDEDGNAYTAFTKGSTKNKLQEFVVVNKPLENAKGRKNSDVEQDCFLLEIDGDKNDYPEFDEVHKKDGVQWKGSEEEKESANDAILKYMIPFIEENKKYLKWVCSSGRVSEHVALKTNLPKTVVNPELRAFIFDKINKKWFDGRLDKACKNASRLGRNPNAIRNNGNVQTAMFINEDCEALDVSQWVNEYNSQKKVYVEYTGKESDKPVEEQFEVMVNTTHKPSGLLALKLFKGEKVGSGENLIGAVAYCRTLKEHNDKWIPVYNKVLEEARKQHPTNIGKYTK